MDFFVVIILIFVFILAILFGAPLFTIIGGAAVLLFYFSQIHARCRIDRVQTIDARVDNHVDQGHDFAIGMFDDVKSAIFIAAHDFAKRREE